MVANSPGSAGRHSTQNSPRARDLSAGVQGKRKRSGVAQVASARLQALRRRLTNAGFSDRAAKAALEHIGERANSAKDAVWKRFSSFCESRNIDPVAAPVAVAADWLVSIAGTDPIEGGLAAETVRKYVSDLCTTRDSLGVSWSTDPNFDLFKMVELGLRSRPDKTIRSEIDDNELWSTDRITQHWSSATDVSSMEDLRARALSLVQLAILARASDLERMDGDTVTWSREKVSFRIFRGKGRVGYSHTMSIPFLPGNKACAAAAFREYWLASESLRNVCPRAKHDTGPVWVSLASPVKPLSAERISKIISKSLQEAGVKARTHSVRGRGASSALDAGFSPWSVMRLGRWRSQEVINRHYYKSAATTAVSSSLLQSSS